MPFVSEERNAQVLSWLAICLAVGAVAAALWIVGGQLLDQPIVTEERAVALGRVAFLPQEPRIDLREEAPGSEVLEGHVELVDGWAQRETWGIWAVGTRSVIDIALLEGGHRSLVLECKPYPGRSPSERQAVAVEVNGVACGTVEVRGGTRPYVVRVPEGAVRAGVNRFVFDYRYAVSPAEVGRGSDPRELSVAFRRLALLLDEDVGRRGAIWTPALSVDRQRGEVEVRRSGRLVVPLRTPHRPEAVTVEVGGGGRGWLGTGTAGCRLSLCRFDGSISEAQEVGRIGAHEWASRVLALGDGAPAAALLADVELSGGAANLVVRVPHLAYTAADSTALERRVEPPTELPDIVVIVLDALRADHVGAYGYRRPTTPAIDRLAAESLVFSNVFAIAPYTLCSVPTMVTGLSWRDHDVVLLEDRLSDEAVTMAESLGDLGYTRLAFSATPNFSPGKGTHQGFDEFHEVWKGVPFERGVDPFHLTEQVLTRLERGIGEQPLYLHLHYVPPHGPYTPRKEFDIFGDPSYSGPVDGSQSNLWYLEKHRLVPTEEDVAEIVALYDGNLLMADEAVSRVLEVLRRSGRWDRTVVLVTADHGEAFFEHGELGHNSTVYDDMLHVPFILRLPPGVEGGEVDQERFGSLEDLTPTLLGLAGLGAPPGVAGLDLLAEEGAPFEHRFLVARTAFKTTTFALRTDRWKALAGGFTDIRELYDVSADPGEILDLGPQRPELYAFLRLLLEQELARGSGALTAGEATVTSEDEDMLRALGYVD
jgi:arylsulfatase A-like enzyme